jgi:LmbE family N-acetylglucosaminyl deacetylase
MSEVAPLDVLAIAAHPDDVELSVGGTLVKLSEMGYRTGILDLTRGEAGTRGTPEIRATEARRAAQILGCAVRENWDSQTLMSGSTKNRGPSWSVPCDASGHASS